MKTSLDGKVKAAFRAGMGVTLAVSAVAYLAVGRLVESSGWVSHTQEVLLTVERVLSRAHAAESEQRGYLLIGEASFLAEFMAESDIARSSVRSLGMLVRDNPGQELRAVRLDSLVNKWIGRLDNTVNLSGPAWRRATLEAGVSDQKSLFGSIDSIAREMEDEERGLLLMRTANARKTAFFAHMVIILGMLFSTITIIMAMRLNFRGIEDRRRASLDLLRAKDEAEAGSKAKSEFLANMSHELRTPLNSIIGFAQVLLKNKDANLSAKDLSYLDKVRANGRHLLELINSILDLSKIEAGKMTVERVQVDLADLAVEVASQFETLAADRKLELIVDAPDGMSAIPADRGKLKQVLINLIGNAIKFTETGSVVLRVAVHPGTGLPERIQVEDTGPGIPPDRQAAIFESFQQADNSITRRYGGTGLGLAISRGLADLMGFGFEVRSSPGKGSVFTLSLNTSIPLEPLRAGSSPAGLRRASNPVSMPGRERPGYVLVIDDDADSRTLTGQLLEEAGYRSVPATGGAEGIAIAKAVRPLAVVLDLLMPEMDGPATLASFVSEPILKGVPVIIVSIVAGDHRFKLPGPAFFLDKPLDKAGLADALEKSLAADPAGPPSA
ncbi:MAG: integral rane sensor hybrid histidine kinase [Fibrobacteres bacterium]|nr:integral rane sensor hybrid histidine kinase [Fibrobacterota bacterium]